MSGFSFEDNTLSCDSAFFNQISNTFDAMGHVKMHRGTGNVSLSSVRASYNSLSKIFTASKHVVMTQPGNSLHCDSLIYNVESHTANYYGNGRLSGNGATVTSEQGDYNTKTHDAHFTGHRVVLHSPEYTVTTPSLNYNTQTKRDMSKVNRLYVLPPERSSILIMPISMEYLMDLQLTAIQP